MYFSTRMLSRVIPVCTYIRVHIVLYILRIVRYAGVPLAVCTLPRYRGTPGAVGSTKHQAPHQDAATGCCDEFIAFVEKNKDDDVSKTVVVVVPGHFFAPNRHQRQLSQEYDIFFYCCCGGGGTDGDIVVRQGQERKSGRDSCQPLIISFPTV